MTDSQSQGRRTAGASSLLRDGVYRTFFAVLVLKGLAVSTSVPFLAIWLAKAFAATPVEVGLLRMAIGVAALAYALVVARATDRGTTRRAWLLGSFLTEIAAWVILPRVGSLHAAILVTALATFAGISQLFALLSDWMIAKRAPSGSTINSLRMAFALGWVMGPALGSFLMRAGGPATVFGVTAALQLVALLVAALWLKNAPPRPSDPSSEKEQAPPPGAVARFLVVLFLAFAADGASRTTLLPLYVIEGLIVPVTTFGLILTGGVIGELPVFLFAGRLADAIGTRWVVAIGLGMLALSFVLLAAWHSVAGVAVAELVRLPFIAALHGSAMAEMQRLLPRRAGLAMGLYGAAFQLGPAVGAPLLGFLAERHGWSSAFLACTGVSVIALVVHGRPAARNAGGYSAAPHS